jgi:hypothetical protein
MMATIRASLTVVYLAVFAGHRWMCGPQILVHNDALIKTVRPTKWLVVMRTPVIIVFSTGRRLDAQQSATGR